MIYTYINYYFKIKENLKEREKSLFEQWGKSKKYPRKLKKKIRKEILLEFSTLELGKRMFNW